MDKPSDLPAADDGGGEEVMQEAFNRAVAFARMDGRRLDGIDVQAQEGAEHVLKCVSFVKEMRETFPDMSSTDLLLALIFAKLDNL